MKLSIIVPAYNIEKYIEETITSLLSIKFDEQYEIIVINDGSTDSTEDIIKRITEKDLRVRLITIKNAGVSNARNVGIDNSTGEYLSFVDGDDTVSADFFKIAVEELDGGHYDLVQGNYLVVNNQKTQYCERVLEGLELNEKTEKMEYFLSPKTKLIHNAVWGKVYRTETIKKVRFDDHLVVAEDQKFVFDYLLHFEII